VESAGSAKSKRAFDGQSVRETEATTAPLGKQNITRQPVGVNCPAESIFSTE
jgi:hypothetical protein